MAAALEEGHVLQGWLTMLGWQVELEPDGQMVVGVGRHLTADGRRLVVGAYAPTRSDAVWQLFERAMAKLGGNGPAHDLGPRRPGLAAAA
jgi:hypothetical protein